LEIFLKKLLFLNESAKLWLTISVRSYYGPPVAICLEAEGRGLSRALKRRADHPISIPMAFPVKNLSVAVAAGIIFIKQDQAGEIWLFKHK